MSLPLRPIDYGLRDYGTAKREGGDEDCDHRYREDKRDETSTLHGPGNAEGYALNHYKNICKKCGATRIDAQLGLEPTLKEYIDNTVRWCAEVWRVLRDDGVFWLNLGDSYSGNNSRASSGGRAGYGTPREGVFERGSADGFKHKDLMIVPHRVVIALQEWGWYFRSDIVWNKTNPMPESVTDRPTKAHESIFLLTKSGRSQYWTHPNKRGCREKPDPDYYWKHKETGLIVDYPPVSKLTLREFWKRHNRWKGHDYFYDVDAIREPHADASLPRALRGVSETNKYRKGAPGSTASAISQPRKNRRKEWEAKQGGGGSGFDGRLLINPAGRNKRTVWTMPTQPYKGAHFATFPTKLPEICIKAGTSEKGVCPVCGSPWERDVVKKPTGASQKMADGWDVGTGTHTAIHRSGRSKGELEIPVMESVTVGWKPTCSHSDKPVPAIALDPFGGSGTTAMVANQLGRTGLSFDLSWEYLLLAKERTGARAIAEWEKGKGKVESNLDGLPIFELLKGDQEK